jgi:hypothetical protein
MADATTKYSHVCKVCKTKTSIPTTKLDEQCASHTCSGMSCNLVFYQCGFCNKATRSLKREIHRHQKECSQHTDTSGESNEINAASSTSASTTTSTSLETPIRAGLTSSSLETSIRAALTSSVTKTCSKCSHVMTLTQPNHNVSGNFFEIHCPRCDNSYFQCSRCLFVRKHKHFFKEHISKYHPESQNNNHAITTSPTAATSNLTNFRPTTITPNQINQDPTTVAFDDGTRMSCDADSLNDSQIDNSTEHFWEEGDADDNGSQEPNFEHDEEELAAKETLPYDFFVQVFPERRRLQFFYQEYSERDGGRRGITYRTFHDSGIAYNADSNVAHHNINKFVTQEEADFMFDLTGLLQQATPKQRDQLSRMLISISRATANFTVFPNIILPTSLNDFHSYCSRKRDSVMHALPYEKLTMISNHACIKLSDKISTVMAFGIDLEFYDSNATNQSGLNRSAAMARLHEKLKKQPEFIPNSTKIGFLMFWSDGFQQHYVRTKDNSVWMLTVTICPPWDKKFSIFHTYVLAIGRKSSDHVPVMKAYYDELESIRKGQWRYCGKSRKKIHTMFDLLIYPADRPEKSELCFTLQTGAWMHSIPYERKSLASCDDCVKRRQKLIQDWYSNGINPAQDTGLCSRCRDWDRTGTSTIFQKPAVPKDYPRAIVKGRVPKKYKLPKIRNVPTKHILPFKQNFEILRQGCRGAFYNCAKGTWSAKETEKYLKTLGINANLSTNIIESASWIKQQPLPVPNGTVTKMSNAHIPRLWLEPLSMDIFVDSPMHLLFLGITKSMLGLVRQFAAAYSLLSKYIRVAAPPMEKIKNFGLNFCRLEPFNDSTKKKIICPQWLSDNCLAFVRVMPMICGILFEDIVTNSTAEIHVKHTDQLKSLLVSCFVMISHIMSPDDVPPDVIDHHVKIFLQKCFCFGETDSEQERSHFWENKPNFWCLLNLRDQIELFGAVRNYWEGDRERAIQKVKPIIKRMRKKATFFLSVMKKIMIYEILDILYLQQSSRFNDEHDFQNSEESRTDWFYVRNTEERHNIYTYKDSSLLIKDMTEMQPFVGYLEVLDHQLRLPKLYVLVGTKKENVKKVEIVFSSDGHYSFSLWHEKCGIARAILGTTSRNELKNSRDRTCIFLPMAVTSKRGAQYSVVCDDWKVRHKGGTFALPRLSDDTFKFE